MADDGEMTEQTYGDESTMQLGEKWGDPISEERQAELRMLFERQQTWVVQPEATRGDSVFIGVRLTGADVYWLAEASGRDNHGRVSSLHLEGANLSKAQLDGADLSGVCIGGIKQGGALDAPYIYGANLAGAQLVDSKFCGAALDGADLSDVRGWRADFSHASMRGATLFHADFGRANFDAAHLDYANCATAVISGATLYGAHLDGADMCGTDFQDTRLDVTTDLKRIRLDSATKLSDVLWNGVPLTRVEWEDVQRLGDEGEALKLCDKEGKRKSDEQRLRDYQAAYRAYRQLALALRSHGLNDNADHYAYRAQLMQRVALRMRRRYLQYFGSLFIDLLAGYGFRPVQSLLVYLAVILWFANFYVWASHGLFSLGLPPTHVQPLAWYEGLILSVSSFHGRGFQPFQNLNDPVAALAGMQAVLGLIIEVSFIATFTQRFFAR